MASVPPHPSEIGSLENKNLFTCGVVVYVYSLEPDTLGRGLPSSPRERRGMARGCKGVCQTEEFRGSEITWSSWKRKISSHVVSIPFEPKTLSRGPCAAECLRFTRPTKYHQRRRSAQGANHNVATADGVHWKAKCKGLRQQHLWLIQHPENGQLQLTTSLKLHRGRGRRSERSQMKAD